MRIMRSITIPDATGTPLRILAYPILAYPFNTHTRGAFLRFLRIWYAGSCQFPRILRTGNRVSEKTSSRKVSEQRLSPLRNCKTCLQASRLPPYFSRPCVVREQGAKLWDAEGTTGSGTTGAKRSRSGEA